MAIIIDSSIGGSNSNSYLSILRSNILAETMPHMDEWLTNVDINKAQLLVHATRLIDRHFKPAGEKAFSSQALGWPRGHVLDVGTGILLSSEVIPSFVEMATIEWAWALRENPDPYTDIGIGLKRLETPSYRMEFNGQTQQVIPRPVTMLLAPYSMKSLNSPFHRVVRM